MLEQRLEGFAGRLQDASGRPLANCTLHVGDVGSPGRAAKSPPPQPTFLKTDAKGRFIIYSWNSEFTFFAAPGYPLSAIGLRFAAANGGFVKCVARKIAVSQDINFFIVTCPRGTNFDDRKFREFFAREMAQWKGGAEPLNRETYYHDPHMGIQGVDPWDWILYQIRVVSPEGKPIPDAVLRYSASDGHGTTHDDTVSTDADGTCRLVDKLFPRRPKSYYDGVRRQLYVDIPGYASGPLRFRPQKGAVNVITAPKPATIRGRLVERKRKWALRVNALCILR